MVVLFDLFSLIFVLKGKKKLAPMLLFLVTFFAINDNGRVVEIKSWRHRDKIHVII